VFAREDVAHDPLLAARIAKLREMAIRAGGKLLETVPDRASTPDCASRLRNVMMVGAA
jgi:hypothetical protein